MICKKHTKNNHKSVHLHNFPFPPHFFEHLLALAWQRAHHTPWQRASWSPSSPNSIQSTASSNQSLYQSFRVLVLPLPYTETTRLNHIHCCILHSFTQWTIHYSTSKTLCPLQPQSICSTLVQDDCSKTIAIHPHIPNDHLITIQL